MKRLLKDFHLFQDPGDWDLIDSHEIEFYTEIVHPEKVPDVTPEVDHNYENRDICPLMASDEMPEVVANVTDISNSVPVTGSSVKSSPLKAKSAIVKRKRNQEQSNKAVRDHKARDKEKEKEKISLLQTLRNENAELESKIRMFEPSIRIAKFMPEPHPPHIAKRIGSGSALRKEKSEPRPVEDRPEAAKKTNNESQYRRDQRNKFDSKQRTKEIEFLRDQNDLLKSLINNLNSK